MEVSLPHFPQFNTNDPSSPKVDAAVLTSDVKNKTRSLNHLILLLKDC